MSRQPPQNRLAPVSLFSYCPPMPDRSFPPLTEAERDLPSAEEAEKIASGIAIKNLNFRDIRGRREALKKLVQALRMGGGAPAPGTQPA